MITHAVISETRSDGDIFTKIVAGAYWKELPDSIVYEASILLTYTAIWDSELEDMQELRLKNCSTSQIEEWCIASETLRQLGNEFDKQIK